MYFARICFPVVLAACLSLLSANLYGQSAFESVKESTDILLAKLKEVQPVYEEDPNRFFLEVQSVLDPYIDFESFARGVMATHYKRATVPQREAFTAKFRESLVKTYATALLEFDNQQVLVVEPTTPQKRDDRATVELEVRTSSGAVYPIQYQLGRLDDRWLLRNVVIDGINIGLQFRSQFNAYMQQHGQDIDKVIAHWSVDVDSQA